MRLIDLCEYVGSWGEWVSMDGDHSLPLDKCCHFSPWNLKTLDVGKNPFKRGYVHINVGDKKGQIAFSALPSVLHRAFDTIIVPRLKENNYQSFELTALTELNQVSREFKIADIELARQFAKEASEDPRFTGV